VDSVRDWGHAKDFARAYWLIMSGESQTSPDTYVVSTGQSASVKDFVTYCYEKAGFTKLKWAADGLYSSDRLVVRINQQSMTRVKEVPYLRGDSTMI
jgi:GDPmannose 4,6-dehydratase